MTPPRIHSLTGMLNVSASATLPRGCLFGFRVSVHCIISSQKHTVAMGLLEAVCAVLRQFAGLYYCLALPKAATSSDSNALLVDAGARGLGQMFLLMR